MLFEVWFFIFLLFSCLFLSQTLHQGGYDSEVSLLLDGIPSRQTNRRNISQSLLDPLAAILLVLSTLLSYVSTREPVRQER